MLDERKQRHPQESYGDYQDAILQIALQAETSIPDTELVDVLLNNARPGLQIALAGKHIYSIGQLGEEARYLERLWRQLKHDPEAGIAKSEYKLRDANRGFRSQVHELESPAWNIGKPPVDNADTRNEYENFHTPIEQEEHPETVNAMEQPTRNPNQGRLAPQNRPPQRCWNCKMVGHPFQLCRQTRQVFCYGCGLSDTYLPDCPQCQKSSVGNLKARENHRRGSSSQATFTPRDRTTTEAASNTDPELYQLLRRNHTQP